LPRYCFADFILSPRRRVLTRAGRELRLIPRYFDLLVFLVERRHEAVHRRDIFDRVWNDVVVSDSALSQAIRTLRRTLGDDSREPAYIRTVARHGYRFVFANVVEEEDDGDWQATEPASEAGQSPAADPFEPLLQRLTGHALSAEDEQDQRDAAERLHALGTAEALARLAVRPRHAFARALLRDTRWDAPSAGAVPLVGQPGFLTAAAVLVGLRLRRTAQLAAARGIGASLGAAVAGVVAGAVGGLMLAGAPGSDAPVAVAAVLAVIGAFGGAVGGGGIGSGISVGEATARSGRGVAIVAGGALGGTFVGYLVQWLARWSLTTLVGVRVAVGGGLEGLVLGSAAGLGYAFATRRLEGGLAAPRGGRRLTTATLTALTCAIAGLAISAKGRPLMGGTIHAIAEASAGSQAVLTPLGRLIGDPDFGPLTRTVIGTGEAALFGFGLAIGLTRRPRLVRNG
jgi:DNA-binding winged helix-turn-helix (wHTH) protein